MTEGLSRWLTATSYLQMMSHTAPVNIGVFFGITGQIITTSSACTSGSQGNGYLPLPSLCPADPKVIIDL